MKFVFLADRRDLQEVFGKKRLVSRLNERFQVKNPNIKWSSYGYDHLK